MSCFQQLGNNAPLGLSLALTARIRFEEQLEFARNRNFAKFGLEGLPFQAAATDGNGSSKGRKRLQFAGLPMATIFPSCKHRATWQSYSKILLAARALQQ
jgi:hypothetical protein